MKSLKLLMLPMILTLSIGAAHASASDNSGQVLKEVHAMFDAYMEVYNRRFTNVIDDEGYQTEIAQYLYAPLLMFPPTNKPAVMDTPEAAAKNFAGFTAMLMRKGVTRLKWHDMQLRVLSPTKVLANNVGRGSDVDGNLVYETVSVYVVYKSDDGWKIQTLNPYLVENKWDFS